MAKEMSDKSRGLENLQKNAKISPLMKVRLTI